MSAVREGINSGRPRPGLREDLQWKTEEATAVSQNNVVENSWNFQRISQNKTKQGKGKAPDFLDMKLIQVRVTLLIYHSVLSSSEKVVRF